MKPKNPTIVSWSIYSDILLDNTWHIFSSLLKPSVLFADDLASYFTKTTIRKLLLSENYFYHSPPYLATHLHLYPYTLHSLLLLRMNCPCFYLNNPLFEQWAHPLFPQDFFITEDVPFSCIEFFTIALFSPALYAVCTLCLYTCLYAIIHLKCL